MKHTKKLKKNESTKKLLVSYAYKLFSKREVIGKLCFGEVRVDLELCVHAHGHDVALIIKASLKLIIPLV